jgi:AcrR family transcriptional regulator
MRPPYEHDTLAEPVRCPEPRASRHGVNGFQRARIIRAVARIAYERGPERATVGEIVRRAGVSRGTFYAFFEDRSDCLRVAVEDAVAVAADRVATACRAEADWRDRIRAGLFALLQILDEQPELARLCVTQAVTAGAGTLSRRWDVPGVLAAAIDEGRGESRDVRRPPPLAAEGVLGGALYVIHGRLLGPDPVRLLDLLNPLMGMIVLPYLGEEQALAELARPAPEPPATAARKAEDHPLEGLNMRLTHRTIQVLAVIAGEPGLSNNEISERAGVTDQGQISKLLGRLARLELAENTGGRRAGRETNAWTLTAKAHELLRAAESMQ